MPKVTEEHLEGRRRQIVEAAYRCFARKGFHPTTMQDICAEAQLSAGAVYRYFASKEEIIEVACEAAAEQKLPVLVEAMGRPGFADLIQELARYFFRTLAAPDSVEENRATVQLWAEAVVNDRVRAINAKNMDEVRATLKGIVSTAKQNGEISGDADEDSLAAVMVSLYTGFLLQKALDLGVDADTYSRAVVALFTGTLSPNSSPPVSRKA